MFSIDSAEVDTAADVLQCFDGDVDATLDACMANDPRCLPLTESEDGPPTEDDREFYKALLELGAELLQ